MKQIIQTASPVRRGGHQRRRPKAFLLGSLVAALVFSFLPVGGEVQASGLLIAKGGFGGRLLIKEQVVRVTINNGIAVTEVNQIFVNTENRIVEALYTFPVPAHASVSNFSMIINGKEMIGEVVEKRRAKQIYESYKKTKRDPGLLEQVDYKTFEMRVFPIQPKAEQHIKVVYYQPLDVDHDWTNYVFPLATSTEGVNEKTSGKFSFTLDVKSEIPVTKITSPSHAEEFVVVNHANNYASASMEVPEGDLSRDVVIAFQTKRARTGLDLITSRHAGEDGFFMLSLTAGEELEQSTGGMDYVFVVDISGSMRNDGKLKLSQQAVQAFVSALGAEDKFDAMVFNSAPEMMFGQLNQVSDQGKGELEEFLGKQFARGGTDLRPAMMAAYRYKQPDRELNVVVLSDGMTDRGEQQELLALIGEAPPSSKVFCVGIGNDVNRPLLTQLAEGAGGLATFISHGDNFERQANAFRRKLVHPVATDISIEVEGVSVYDVLPGELPNLYYGKPLRLIGRYEGAGAGDVTIRGTVMGKAFEQTVNFDFPKMNPDNPQIDRMWAWYQVQNLMGKMRKGGKSVDLENQIVDLCEGYSIVSQYASFIVLENDSEYKRWKIERRNAIRIQRDRQARQKLNKELENLRNEKIAKLGPSVPGQTKKPAKQTRDRQGRSTPQTVQRTPPRGRDLNFGKQPVSTGPQSSDSSSGGDGGGAIDPITGLIAAGLAGAAAARRKRKGLAESVAEKTGEEAG